MKICVVSGSRADAGLLAWPRRCLEADPFFTLVEDLREAEYVLLLGDRWEILVAALQAQADAQRRTQGGGGVTSLLM